MDRPLNGAFEPYKGLESYQVEDASLFFGRDDDARQLVARILSRRLTLLHAPSGAGKTSLLNARVIPALESRGWVPVRAVPGDDPLASIRAATVGYLLPPLSAELAAVRAARAALPQAGPAPTLGSLLKAYDALPLRDPRKRALIAPLEVDAAESRHHAGARTIPYFVRLLRSSISIQPFEDHFHALPVPEGFEPIPLTFDTPVEAVERMLASESVASSYTALLSLATLPVPTLLDFFENLFEVYAPRAGFCLVLILDQMEELFTRFGDRPTVPSYRLRERAFREVAELHARVGQQEEGAAPALPLRLVFSMRDEYLARVLDQVHALGGLDGEPRHHLYLLRKRDARTAVAGPAAAYGYPYQPRECVEIVRGLSREKRFVEPTALQIVCEKLWHAERDTEARRAQAGEPPRPPGPGMQTLRGLGGVRGILASFFSEFIDREFTDARARFEALEVLEQLVTANRTRNIVERDQLVRQPFRDARLREQVLATLQTRKIVRVEQRLDGYFVEITHEFLIDPVLERIKQELTGKTPFRDALRSLAHFEAINFRVGPRLLSEEHVRALHEYFTAAERNGRITLPAWSVELMFRSAIFRGLERETVRFWCEQLRSLPAADVDTLLAEVENGNRNQSLSLEELWLLRGWNGRIRQVTARQAEHVLVSLINESDDSEREDVRDWARRYADTCRAGATAASNGGSRDGA